DDVWPAMGIGCPHEHFSAGVPTGGGIVGVLPPFEDGQEFYSRRVTRVGVICGGDCALAGAELRGIWPVCFYSVEFWSGTTPGERAVGRRSMDAVVASDPKCPRDAALPAAWRTRVRFRAKA